MPTPTAYAVIKRAFDFAVALAALLVVSPIVLLLSLLIFLQDFHSPFFVATRTGRAMKPFRMIKFRSMIVGAHKLGAQSTAGDDARITRLGAFIRRFKLDELPQFINVVKGDMSFVGPRPNVPSEVALYSTEESHLLDVRPGITDFASIVFADEGDILEGSTDPDRDYNLLIRPWKSYLGLHYVATTSLSVDIRLIWLTVVTVLDRARALAGVQRLLRRTGANEQLIRVASRQDPLVPTLPPGVTEDDWEEHLTYEVH